MSPFAHLFAASFLHALISVQGLADLFRILTTTRPAQDTARNRAELVENCGGPRPATRFTICSPPRGARQPIPPPNPYRGS